MEIDKSLMEKMKKKNLDYKINAKISEDRNRVMTGWIEEDIENQLFARYNDYERTVRKLDLAEKRKKAYINNPVLYEAPYLFETEDNEYIEAKKDFDLVEMDNVIEQTKELLIIIEKEIEFFNSDECKELVKKNKLAKKLADKKAERAKK